jgi:hypothetical protein
MHTYILYCLFVIYLVSVHWLHPKNRIFDKGEVCDGISTALNINANARMCSCIILGKCAGYYNFNANRGAPLSKMHTQLLPVCTLLTVIYQLTDREFLTSIVGTMHFRQRELHPS